jgi:hypothetical protein
MYSGVKFKKENGKTYFKLSGEKEYRELNPLNKKIIKMIMLSARQKDKTFRNHTVPYNQFNLEDVLRRKEFKKTKKEYKVIDEYTDETGAIRKQIQYANGKTDWILDEK